jgi:hypothetical protein
MHMSVAEISRQEEADDLPLSVLYGWQKVLGVPITELLVEPEYSLSRPLKQRAQLVRVMKTSLALLETADGKGTGEMAQTLVDQLVKIMPELQGVDAWHDVGAAALRQMPDGAFTRRTA